MNCSKVMLFITCLAFQLQPVLGFDVTRKGQLCQTQVNSAFYEPSWFLGPRFLQYYDLSLRSIDPKTNAEVNADIDDMLDRSWCWNAFVATNTPRNAAKTNAESLKTLHDCACANLRPWITSVVVTVYQCDLPAGPQLAFLSKLKSKAKRYSQLIRLHLAVFRDMQVTKIFDELMTSCFYDYIDEQIISILRATGSLGKSEEEEEVEKERTMQPTKPLKTPNQPTPSPSATVPKPSKPVKTSPPASTPVSSAIITNEPVLPISSAPPAPSDKTEQRSSTAPDPGMPERAERNEDYSAVAQQIATLATAVIVLIGLLFVLATGMVGWIWWRNRIRSSEYQPLVTVAPSMDIFDSNE